MNHIQNVANDNERIDVRRRVNFANRSFATQTARPVRTPPQIQEIPFGTRNTAARTSKFLDTTEANMMALMMWIASFALVFIAQRDFQLPFPKIAASVAFGWASLLLFYISKRQGRNFYKTLGTLGAIASLIVSGYTLHAGLNIAIPSGLVLCLGAVLTLALGAFTNEKLPVLVSILLSAVWVGLVQFGDMAAQIIWLFPSLFILQFYLSRKMRTPFATLLCCLTLLLWNSGYVSIPLTYG